MIYEGRLSDGTVFDSCDDGASFGFEIGRGKVIRGWDVGVATMRVGERAELVCRSEYAYGAAGSPPDIPADAHVKPPRASGAKVDAAAELARLSLQREARAAAVAASAVAASAEERKSSAQKREEAKAAVAARLANKGQKKGGKK